MKQQAIPLEIQQRRIAQRLFQILDGIAGKRGFARFADIPAAVMDVNEADAFVAGELRHYILAPLSYAKGWIERHPSDPASAEMAGILQQGREARRKLERHLRRFLQSTLTAWQDDVLPTLLDAQALARDEHREDEPIGTTITRLAADGRLRVPSSFFVYELGRAIGLKDFTAAPNKWPATQLKAGRAELRPSTVNGDEWTQWAPTTLAAALEKMNTRLDSLGQRTRDIYYIMLAKWVHHRASGAEGNPWIAVDEILRLLGHQKKVYEGGAHYGYLERDRWMVRQAIEALGDVHVSLKIPQPGKRKVIPYEGHFIGLLDRRGQPMLGTDAQGKSLSAFTHIEFALPALARQGVEPHAAPYLYLHIKALQYTGKQALEKAVAYYLAEMSRINATGTVRVTVGRLLEEAGMGAVDPRKATATRDRMHHALNTLADDGVAAEWSYADAEWEQRLRRAQDAGKRPRGWALEWLQQALDLVLPPEFSYATIATHRQERLQRKPPKRITPPPAEAFTLASDDASLLAKRIAHAIQAQRISKAEAATAIGITRPTLNALLAGKPTSATTHQRATAWLHHQQKDADA